MMIMFLPMPSGPTGPWVVGTKNLKERKVLAALTVFLGFIVAGLLFYIALFVDKLGSFSQKDPSTLMGSFLTDAGLNGPLSLLAMFAILIVSFAASVWVGGSEKPIARISAFVVVLIQILFIISAYIPA